MEELRDTHFCLQNPVQRTVIATRTMMMKSSGDIASYRGRFTAISPDHRSSKDWSQITKLMKGREEEAGEGEPTKLSETDLALLSRILLGLIYHFWIVTRVTTITCSTTSPRTASIVSSQRLTLSSHLTSRKLRQYLVAPWLSQTAHSRGKVTVAVPETAHSRRILEIQLILVLIRRYVLYLAAKIKNSLLTSKTIYFYYNILSRTKKAAAMTVSRGWAVVVVGVLPPIWLFSTPATRDQTWTLIIHTQPSSSVRRNQTKRTEEGRSRE